MRRSNITISISKNNPTNQTPPAETNGGIWWYKTKIKDMDLRNLAIARLEELIAINERKANQPMTSERIKVQLADAKIKLQRALDYKLKNA